MLESLEPETRSWRRTKIFATLGPVSSNYSVIEQLALKGVDVFRINFSHGVHHKITSTIENIRAIEKATRDYKRMQMDTNDLLMKKAAEIFKVKTGAPLARRTVHSNDYERR